MNQTNPTEPPKEEILTLESVNEAFKKLQGFYWEQIERLEERVERQEGMIAMLTQGFAEVASSVEGVMYVMANESEEKGEELRQALLVSKEKIMKVLNSSFAEEQEEKQ